MTPRLGLLSLLAGAGAFSPDHSWRAVQLFRKPEYSTGRLILVEEGLAVLKAQKEPFAIVSAIGPTRTGKSSILGRAFLREHGAENTFEVGNGVTSHTGGVWMLSKPLTYYPRLAHDLRKAAGASAAFPGQQSLRLFFPGVPVRRVPHGGVRAPNAGAALGGPQTDKWRDFNNTTKHDEDQHTRRVLEHDASYSRFQLAACEFVLVFGEL